MEDLEKMSTLRIDANFKGPSMLPNGNADANDSTTYLVETFYITSKKNTVFRVKLTNKGLILRKETNVSAKEQTIPLQDIIGCRCLRSKRKRNRAASCTCASLPGPTQLKVVEENSLDLDESDVSAYLYIYAYILKKNSRRNSSRRERTTITLRFRSFDKYEDNNREAQKWRTAIKQSIDCHGSNNNIQIKPMHSVTSSPELPYVPRDTRKVLVLLNPKSGSGKARETFQKTVAPIFVEAEVPFELCVTKCANYAREFVRNKDIYSWKFVIVVGGDGIYFEVINGLLERSDWERALHTFPIGIIPCGSGNGLARSIAHAYSEPYEPKPILYAALNAVRGRSAPMDLVRVETRSQILFSFLSVGWGLISDIDIESERLRSFGYQRFAIWSVHRLINLRTYHGVLSYLPYDVQNDNDNEKQRDFSENRINPTSSVNIRHSMSYNIPLECSDCHGDGDCETCDNEFGDVLSLETNSNTLNSYRPRLDSWYSATSRKSTYFSTTESVYQSVGERLSTYGSDIDESKTPAQMYGPSPTIPALTTPVPSSWEVITGDFVMVHAVYQTHIGADCFFAPNARLNDGVIWLVVIQAGASRQELFKFLLGLSTGTHIPATTNEFIKMIPVKAFRIEPSGSQGHFSVDGERVEYGPIQCEIFPGIAEVLVPNYT